MRSTDDEKNDQIAAVARVPGAPRGGARPRRCARLQEVARARGNVFEALMEAVKVASLGEISRRPLRRRAASTGGTCSDARRRGRHRASRRGQRRAHRLPRAERHRAALRSRPGGAARRAHRLLHPSVGDRARRSRRWAAPRTSSSTGSASSRRRTSSSTSTRTEGDGRGARRVRPVRSSSPTRSRREDNLDALPAARRRSSIATAEAERLCDEFAAALRRAHAPRRARRRACST